MSLASIELIPAVDIRAGRCVRLVEGDFSREKRYADNPAEMARYWQAQGATRLHVVDLDGARDGIRLNATAIRALLRVVTIPVQVGGGIRSVETARTVIDEGADRVIIGTAAAEHQDELASWVETLGSQHLLVGVDARAGLVATRGWQQSTRVSTLDFCRALKLGGVERVVYTDVGRDGRLEGPDVEGTTAVARVVRVIASGGVTTLADLQALSEAGAEAAIVGMALYEGRISVPEALSLTC
jgi:phosphoribosylformimino-5-aminoimidazole carboxamide ribotide isomerase